MTLLRGDARHLPIPDESIDLIVTSPPFLNLRSYQDGGAHMAEQIGTGTRDEFLAQLWEATAEMKRVLKPAGSIFVELGDSYTDKCLNMTPHRYAIGCVDQLGLTKRAEIVWSRPNGLPESVTDRVRRSHSVVFHFVKQPRYYSAVDEVREAHLFPLQTRTKGDSMNGGQSSGTPQTAHQNNPLGKLPGSVWSIPTAPLIVPAHLGVDHFAAFPPELVRRIVLGWSPREVCTACGEGRRPVIASVGLDMSRPQARRAQQLADRAGLTEDHLAALLSVGVSDTGRGKATQTGTGKNRSEVYALAEEAGMALGGYSREYLLRRPTGLTTACACPDTTAPSTPGVVLDPFMGTGTTVLVAEVLGRVGIGVDLSADYVRLARWRTSDPGERRRAAADVGDPTATRLPDLPDPTQALF